MVFFVKLNNYPQWRLFIKYKNIENNDRNSVQLFLSVISFIKKISFIRINAYLHLTCILFIKERNLKIPYFPLLSNNNIALTKPFHQKIMFPLFVIEKERTMDKKIIDIQKRKNQIIITKQIPIKTRIN